MKWIDSHCHLTDERFTGLIDEVLSRAKLAGVEMMLTMAGGRNDWPKLLEIGKKYKNVFLAFGWHPEDIKVIEDLQDLEETITKEKGVAIGEIGLDFYYDKEKKTKEVQMEMLHSQMILAKKLNKPVIVHAREAEDETREVLRMISEVRCHFHCFGGSERFLREIVESGHVVSFGGNITFKSAQKLRDLVKFVPKNQLLMETDAPYLSPEPIRGRLNEPANLPLIGQIIAKEIKIEVEELAEVTRQNTICFFGLEN